VDEDPLRLIAAADGVFLRREAIECGYTDAMLASLRRQGVLVRVRHGAYCFGDVWSTYSAEERHLVLARAVLRTTPGPVVLSHTTALIAHGVAVWGADLSKVHVTRLDGGAHRTEADVEHHVGLCPDDDLTTIDAMPVVVLDRAVIEGATVLGLESALVSADSALHTRRCTPDVLYRRFRSMDHWPGSRKIHVVLGLMDGRAESVGESRGRFLFRRQGLPTPDLQFEVYDETGLLVAVTDFVWHEHKAFGEFDGKVKYLRFLREGETPGDAVFREKKREDTVRGITGYGCGRMVWNDLGHPRQTAAYFRHILGLG
jgi:Transcriptional regulator, AbiEi antitoxin